MRSEFDEAWKQNRHVWESTKCLAQAMYLAGEQHQQSKVDELQKRVDGLTQVMEELLEEMKYPTATFEEVICSGVRELEQALKGG